MLSVIHGHLLSQRHITGPLEVISFVVGYMVPVDEMGRIGAICQPHLATQFPRLANEEMKQSVEKIVRKLSAIKDEEKLWLTLREWLVEQASREGRYFEVRNIGQEKVTLPEHRSLQ